MAIDLEIESMYGERYCAVLRDVENRMIEVNHQQMVNNELRKERIRLIKDETAAIRALNRARKEEV